MVLSSMFLLSSNTCFFTGFLLDVATAILPVADDSMTDFSPAGSDAADAPAAAAAGSRGEEEG